MTDTSRFELPLVEASQAQKHVTVNEALTRLDGLMQLTLKSVTDTTPPLIPADGDTYAVASGGVNEWSGEDGNIALYINNGWAFIPVTLGMRAYVVDGNGWAAYDGSNWILGLQTLSANGAGMQFGVSETDHVISAGSTSNVSYALPGSSVVYGVTGRVISEITGTLTSFSLGVSASTTRYGSGLSIANGSWLRGLTGTPLTYYSPEDLVLTGDGGDFASGTIRLSVHYAQFSLPAA